VERGSVFLILRVTLPTTHELSNGATMDQNLERDTVIELLGRLGDEDDESVLAAARSLHATVRAANVDWNDLLLPDGDMEDDLGDDDDIEDSDEIEDDHEIEEDIAESLVTDGAESLVSIDRLLGNPDVSAALKEELEGYKEDISENLFTTSDAAYLKALAERLKQ
jgi:hypothetical protein